MALTVACTQVWKAQAPRALWPDHATAPETCTLSACRDGAFSKQDAGEQGLLEVAGARENRELRFPSPNATLRST